jgi:phospholipase C
MYFSFRKLVGLFAIAAAAAVAGCAGQAGQPTPSGVTPQMSQAASKRATQSIQNVIVVVQQHRSYDNLFAGFKGTNAPTYGLDHSGKHIPLKVISLKTVPKCDDGVNGSYFDTIYNDGKMNGWDLVDPGDPHCPYTRVNPKEIATYWNFAKQYGIADQMFASTRYNSFTDSLYLVAGTTKLQQNTYAIGPPSAVPWGCDAAPGTTTPILKNGHFIPDGPYPCFTQFPTIADLLDAAHISWNTYVDEPTGILPFDPFEAVKAVREGPDWKADTSSPASNVLGDLDDGNLRAVSFVLSPASDSDFPGEAGGPKWLENLVQHAQKSKYWQHLAIFVVWDDFGDGEFYDNVPPAFFDTMGLGLRVPMLAISPQVRRGTISHTQYEYASILKFIEDNWALGSLGSTDQRATSVGNMLSP